MEDNEPNENDDRMDISNSVASAHQEMNETNVEEMIDILSKDVEMIRFVEVSYFHMNLKI